MATAPLLERVLFGHVLTEREARLIGSAAVAISVGFTGLAVAFYLVGIAIGRFSPLSVHLYSTGFEVTGTLACVLLQRGGRVALACLALLLALLATGGATWYLQGGMAPQLVGFNSIAVLVAGLLLGSRGAFAMGAAIASMATWFLWNPHVSYPDLAGPFATPDVIYTIQLACVAGAAGLAHLGYRRLQGALQIAERAEEDLERRVVERTRELEEALEQLRMEVERRAEIQEALHRAQHLASIGTLAAGIAHEINNPVGSILAAADEAQSLYTEPAARSEVETLLRKISHEATRCGRIVKSVLALSRQLPNERWIGDLNQVVRSARDHLEELIASNTAKVELELAPNLAPFPMNPTELEQVVVNLVRNAIENGGHGVHVRIRTESAADRVRLRVLDDGPGVPTAERGRIFDPFYTTRRSQGGAGLGLSLVHGIVTGHGGSVEVRGAPGSGTEFVLEFHLAEAHA